MPGFIADGSLSTDAAVASVACFVAILFFPVISYLTISVLSPTLPLVLGFESLDRPSLRSCLGGGAAFGVSGVVDAGPRLHEVRQFAAIEGRI